MRNEAEVKIKKKSKISDTQQIKSVRCNLWFFWGGSKFTYDRNPSIEAEAKNHYFSNPFLTATLIFCDKNGFFM